MEYLLIALLFVFGLIIGSFLNVVILRSHTGMTVSSGRSVCFSCGRTLAWYELVPVLSFAAQLGRCRSCGSRISWQYPLVEVAGGGAFVLAYLAPGTGSVLGLFADIWIFAAFALTAILLCLYIVIFVYDLRHQIIPDLFSYGAGLVALGLIGIDWAVSGAPDFARMAAGPLLFLFFYAFWKLSRGAWMGLGDGKLALSLGWALGLSQGFAALLMAFWIGAAASLLMMALAPKRLGLRSAIPFAPYLLIGFLIAFAFHVDVQAILSHLAL